MTFIAMLFWRSIQHAFTFFVLDFQNYLRTQTGNNTTVNIIISTVDYLLRVQVSPQWQIFLCDAGLTSQTKNWLSVSVIVQKYL